MGFKVIFVKEWRWNNTRYLATDWMEIIWGKSNMRVTESFGDGGGGVAGVMYTKVRGKYRLIVSTWF